MLISIITINYNNSEGLIRTMNSVFAQTFKPEYVVIDGGSNDGSVSFIKENSEKLAYWISEKDEGTYDAMNKGIKQAKGEFLLFLNSGDYLYSPDTLFKIVPNLKAGRDIVYGNMKISSNGKISNGFMPATLSVEHMLRDTLWHPVSFIRRDLFEKNGFYNTKYRICADYEFFFKMIIVHKVKTKYVKQFISVFDLHGISSDFENVPVIREERRQIQLQWMNADEINEGLNKKQGFKLFRWFR